MHKVMYGFSLGCLQLAGRVASFLPILLYAACTLGVSFLPFHWATLHSVKLDYVLYMLLYGPIFIFNALASALLIQHFGNWVTVKSMNETSYLRLQFLIAISILPALYFSETSVHGMLYDLSSMHLGLSEDGVFLLAVFGKLLWYVGVGLLFWVLLNAFNSVDNVHQFKRGLADYDARITGNADGTCELGVKFAGSVKPNKQRLDCNIPAYYSYVVACWGLFALLMQCVAMVMGEPLIAVVFGGIMCALITLIKDLSILRSQRVFYEYIASMQNKLSAEQVDKDEGGVYE